MAKLGERFSRLVHWADTAWTILGWIGWQKIVAGLALAALGTAGGLMQGIPVSITLMAAFCVMVAALYLFQLPTFIRATEIVRPKERPDPEVWRHVPQLRLYEAACLLADVQPSPSEIRKGEALGWFNALTHAIDSEELPYVPTRHDSQHTFFPGPTLQGVPRYEAHESTRIRRSDLQKFATSRVRRAFLSDG